MTAAQMLAMGGFPDTPEGREAFYNEYPDESTFMAKFGGQMAMGGSTNQIAFPQQPVENKFYSEGFRPSVPFGFYQEGGLTNEVAFPQQPVADRFYNSGWKPSTPFGFYEEGGLTNEIAFPQQPVSDWIHAHTPYVPSYNVGGGLPGGANEMPCFQCGGRMQDGGSADSGTQYGGFVGMGSPTMMSLGGVKKEFKKLIRKQKGGQADGETQDDFLSRYRETFVNNLKQNAYMGLADEAANEYYQQALQQAQQEQNQKLMPIQADYGQEEMPEGQYGINMDTNKNQQFNLVNPQTAANQAYLANQIEDYDTQANNAFGNFFNQSANLLSYLPQAQVGIQTPAGRTEGPYSPEYADFMNAAYQAWSSKSAGKKMVYDPATRRFVTQGTQTTNQPAQRSYGTTPVGTGTYGYNAFPMNYDPYIKFKGNKEDINTMTSLLDRFDPTSTVVKKATPIYRNKVGQFFLGKGPKRVDFKFETTFKDKPMEKVPMLKPENESIGPIIPKKYGGLPKAQFGTFGELAPPTNPYYDNMTPYEGYRPADDFFNNVINTSIYSGGPGSQRTSQFATSETNSPYGGGPSGQSTSGFATSAGQDKTIMNVGAPMVNIGAKLQSPQTINSTTPNTIAASNIYGGGSGSGATSTEVLGSTDTSDRYKKQTWSGSAKQKFGIPGEEMANWLMTGADFLTSRFNIAERNKFAEQMRRNTFADNQFIGLQEPNRGDYNWTGMSTGMLRPNNYVQVEQPGVLPTYFSKYGGSFQDGGYTEDTENIYELTDDEIQEILANGGSVEYLD